MKVIFLTRRKNTRR